tara:strand:- start:5107 stop:5430 length:324 start_codon:yes stop_codon:yes gene_type:complete
MAYNGKSAFVLPRQLRMKDGINVETLAGAKTLDKGSSMIQILDPDGAPRVVNLPDLMNGGLFWISNAGGGGHDLTVTKPDASTILVGNGQGLMIACDGNQWYQVINA